MTWVDWAVVAGFCLASVALGTWMTRRASRGIESYFASNHQLPWWLAGTSIAATAFSSDTPLLVTGMVRRRGIWGVWEVLALAISTMLAVFVFAKLWKRAGVLTEVEFVERRYSGRAAALLRGFKAVYWGLFYNCFVIGAWPVTGLRKVLQEMTGVSKEQAIIGCVALGALYTSCSGLWGVVVTDLFQFAWAMAGAVILAVVAVRAAGGMAEITQALSGTGALNMLPPMPADGSWLSSPFGWFLGLVCLQWWAWKNSDGGGIIVQRLIACRDERQAMASVLWFNIAHYCLRMWPWIITALASLILLPAAQLQTAGGAAFVDHELAYPKLIVALLPTGLRGVMLAAFLAAFLSTLSTHLNWGASYLVNDGYRRFIRRDASDAHYLWVARLASWVLAAGAILVAWSVRSVGEAFTLVLHLTAGIGPVLLLRWWWWRINPWSEIAAMAVSVPALLLRQHALQWLGLPSAAPVELAFMILATACVWVPVTLLTKPVEREQLRKFHAAVQPPGWWAPVADRRTVVPSWGPSLRQWLVGTAALLATTFGPLALMLGRWKLGLGWCAVALAGWSYVWRSVRSQSAAAARREPDQDAITIAAS